MVVVEVLKHGGQDTNGDWDYCSLHSGLLLLLFLFLQWNPAITKCHGTEKNVRYSGVFVIAKTPL